MADISERRFGFAEPFRLTLSADWARAEESSQEILYLSSGSNTIVFAVGKFDTVEEWMDYLTTNPDLVATEPIPIEIGGASGYSSDVRLGPSATMTGCGIQERCVNIISGFRGWLIIANLPNRIWVVDVDGSPVFIAAEASESSFDSFAARAQEVLDTLHWGES